ncbi:hypothetical protein AB0C51_06420 [Streptomyces pathocidini]|nr:hypothetical protein [Streptomyces pathocidini]
MAGGGFVKLPGGDVVVALSLPRPPRVPGEGTGEAVRVRVLVHAANRARALTRLRNLGLRAVYLRGNTEPPTPDEVTAVLHHPDGLVWRAHPQDDTESWHPIRALLRPPAQATRPIVRPAVRPSGWAWEGVLAEWSATMS